MVDIEERLRKNPYNTAALLDRAQAYLTAGECELAVQDYGLVIKHNPRMAKAYLGRSRALEMIGSHAQALLDIDQAIKICDNTCMADALLQKTAVLKALDRGSECPPLYEQLIGSKGLGVGPSDIVNLREQRAALYLRLKKPELALRDLEVCGRARPSSLDIFLNKGKAYALLNSPEKELEAYSCGIKLDNTTRSLNGDRYMADLYQARAKLYKKMGKQSLSEADLNKSRLNQKTLYKEIYEPDKDVDIFKKVKY
jgi:tetratricopeptide (TPR) repeat protein